ncbi:Phosphatidylethanolamine N-methyltransferase [Wickerhamiella sorbophila]|uniref:Phosphatidylethanolamine N-methyltransferase n=1 Tax=Wickerhamiella sorbophila TaxID=45607 RepID=A0A2T0FMW4_9ASCO|nr:Phosphatidylethanolamine N-methyltransferase [Wickerhamiella sorbophila]PRT56338.1 Phosphatidylethanolamine N-methyltransferase [Wickerhamiella sorbophila]
MHTVDECHATNIDSKRNGETRKRGRVAANAEAHLERADDGSVVCGRTSDGIVFEVPRTCDMLHTLLDPRLQKTVLDVITVFILSSYVVLFFILPSSWRIPVFFAMFLSWRAAYNAGIGYLLYKQSNHKALTELTKKYKIFEPSDWWVHRFVMKDLRARLSVETNEEVNKYPNELKTWILFRHLVDLILMSDFLAYVLLGISVLHSTDHSWIVVCARWAAGLLLLAFNLWVKIDAHRVVKDYAWYWGDFFFLEDVNLTFDGVFELAPHPMYSIGYAAYYGASLITSSMTLFVASVTAHMAQFAFLIFVENPHIEKTYNPAGSNKKADDQDDLTMFTPKAMIGLLNFNFTRSSDILVLALVSTTILLYFAPQSAVLNIILFATALCWRTIHTVGLGLLLRLQSDRKKWTRLFLKYGLTAKDAFSQWQAIYNATIVMSYVSLLVLGLRNWESPLNVPFWVFRYIVGVMLIALQGWTSWSIFDSLGEYGWFYGDFFYIKYGHQLTYSGIYRYLNHPERLAGIAGVWGLASICCSSLVTTMAFIWTFYNIGFIQFVEKPHMKKLYGAQNVERDSGVRKNIRKQASLLDGWVDFDKYEMLIENSWNKWIVEYIKNIESLRPRVEGVVSDTRKILKQYPAAMTNITRVDRALVSDGFSVAPSKSAYNYGEPIVVKWTGGKDRTSKDWVGLYRYGENNSKKITNVSSAGRWIGVNRGQFTHNPEGVLDVSEEGGSVVFAGKHLFWESGVYELRYHYKGRHNVLAFSTPFEIKITEQSLDTTTEVISNRLIELNNICLGQQGASVAELKLDDEEVLARFTHGIELIFGIEIAPFVIRADGTAEKLALRLQSIHKTLSTFAG